MTQKIIVEDSGLRLRQAK